MWKEDLTDSIENRWLKMFPNLIHSTGSINIKIFSIKEKNILKKINSKTFKNWVNDRQGQ